MPVAATKPGQPCDIVNREPSRCSVMGGFIYCGSDSDDDREGGSGLGNYCSDPSP